MLFNSYAFLLFFLPAAIVIYAVADRYPLARMPVLITLSLIFYGYWDVRFVPLMLVSIAGNWYAAHLFAATKNRTILTAAIIANLAVLGTFKYTNFLLDSVADLAGMTIAHVSLVLPLGISFFTFHHVMYLADLRRGRAPIYPLDRYALYICFFPQAISGPIARWNEVVRAKDDIYHLGDFTVSKKAKRVSQLLGMLKGRKHLIIGNNDAEATITNKGWTSVAAYREIELDGRLLILCHYPFRTWHNMAKGAIDLHGHSHGKLKEATRQYDVGVDVFDYRPVTLETVLSSKRGRRK